MRRPASSGMRYAPSDQRTRGAERKTGHEEEYHRIGEPETACGAEEQAARADHWSRLGEQNQPLLRARPRGQRAVRAQHGNNQKCFQ